MVGSEKHWSRLGNSIQSEKISAGGGGLKREKFGPMEKTSSLKPVPTASGTVSVSLELRFHQQRN